MSFKKRFVALACVPVGIAITIITLNSRSDTVITEIKTWSEQTPYQVVRARKVDVPNQGVLGKFYSCIADYRHISTRKISGKPTKQGERLLIEVNGKIVIDLGINNTEAFSFSLEKLKGDGHVATSYSYAINCDLSLLDRARD